MKEKNNITNSIEKNRYTFNVVNDWIKFADQKISIIFGLFSVLIPLIVSSSFAKLENINEKTFYYYFLLVISLVGLILFCVGAYFFLWALVPNLKHIDDNKKYSLFFGKISKFKKWDEYYAVAQNIDDEEYNKELIQEIYTNSGICNKKMLRFKSGVILSGLAFIIILIARVFLLLV